MLAIKKIASTILTLGVIFGLKFYSKGSTHDELKTAMLQSCGGSKGCIDLLESRFETCFDSSYSMGRRDSGLHEAEFNRCIGASTGKHS